MIIVMNFICITPFIQVLSAEQQGKYVIRHKKSNKSASKQINLIDGGNKQVQLDQIMHRLKDKPMIYLHLDCLVLPHSPT